jgi:putative nucleotidyltransferase with HDIG domain
MGCPALRSPALSDVVDEMLARGAIDLPVFPAAAQRVLSLCQSEGVDYRELGAVIRQDPTLAAHFLTHANSSAFGARVPIVSLEQALARLGTTHTKHIALVVACKTRAFVIASRPERAHELLQHSVTTALVAQEIARARRHNVEQGFLTGLLHDIGYAALYQLCDDVSHALPIPATDEEVEDVADHLHASVGSRIADTWSMPNGVASIIRGHHTELSGNEPASPTVVGVAIVQLAELFAGGEATPGALIDHPAANILNLYPEDVDTLFAKYTTIAEQVEEL